ncbi:MAG: T9SS type A sorting domain-containing protein [Bacteroidota bacterium]
MRLSGFFSVCLTTALMCIVERMNSQSSYDILIGQNFRIYPSAVTQSEPFIVRHPANPDILFASANTINLANGFVSEGVYVSTNAGATWFGSDTCKGPPVTFHRGDPAIAIDKDGRFILTRLGSSPGLYGHFSTDNGITWSSHRTLALDDQGRGSLATDGVPTSPFYGRTYSVWIRFSPPYPVWFSSTTDGGNSWGVAAAINSPTQRGQGGDIAIGPEGALNICWAGVTGVSPFTEDVVGFARSTNGGTSWSTQEGAFDMNGIAGVFPSKSNIRVNGLPRIAVDNSSSPRNGWLYVVTTERSLSPAGADPDIVLHRSTNNGATWSPGIRVNQDALNNGKIQFFPAVHVDGAGGLNVAYYDDRATTGDSSGVFLSRSTDGGVSWADYGISDRNFKPQPIGGLGAGYQGDNIAMTSVGDTLRPVWMDNRTGIYQLWTSVVKISELGTSVPEGPMPLAFGLDQNYPNPFNPVTMINFSVGTYGHTSLQVFDILGREVATLVDRQHSAGNHRVEFNATGLASGVYIYRMNAGGESFSRMMLLAR